MFSTGKVATFTLLLVNLPDLLEGVEAERGVAFDMSLTLALLSKALLPPFLAHQPSPPSLFGHRQFLRYFCYPPSLPT
jgi:hypothetical protein